MAKVTHESIHADSPIDYDPVGVLNVLAASEGRQVMSIEMGGTKVSSTIYTVEDGRFVIAEQPEVQESSRGIHYLPFLESQAHKAAAFNMPVGISYPGKTEEDRPITAVNVDLFVEDLEHEYAGRFGELFPSFSFLANDAVAGLAATAITVKRELPKAENMLYVINGTGFGLAVLKDGQLVGTEAGHVEAVWELNPYHQLRPCGMFEQDFPCVERVAASGAGIEDIWKQLTGEALSGSEIVQRLVMGGRIPRELYENSIRAIASVTTKVAKLNDFLIDGDNVVIVTHGGAFEVPGYYRRFKDTMDHNLRFDVPIYNFEQNPCAEGAALGALAKDLAA